MLPSLDVKTLRLLSCVIPSRPGFHLQRQLHEHAFQPLSALPCVSSLGVQKLIIKQIPASWLIAEQHRLDCGPFTSGGIEARNRLKRLKTEPLVTLTRNGLAGIYHVGMDKLRWVDGPEHGVPFLGSSDILKADLRNQPFISNHQVENNPLFRCPMGTTLITRSGTIGRLAYARLDLSRVAISQDVLKVVPDNSFVKSGYLYAFLSSKYGIPQITGGTFGSIIVHIEAENIANMPVPRLGRVIELEAHELVERASNNRSEAARLRNNSQTLFASLLNLPDMSLSGTPLSFISYRVTSRKLGRLDAAYHSPFGVHAATAFAKFEPTRLLGEVADVFQTNIFKRPYVDDPQYGYPYYSGAELFTYDPEPRGYLRKSAPGIHQYIVNKDFLLMQDAGQLGGLIGRVMRVTKQQDLSVVSNHLIRINTVNRNDSAYLFTLLSSSIGYRAVVRNAFGSSIPQLESAHLAQISIPWPEESIRRKIADPILESWDLEDAATDFDHEAIALVEKAIEEAS
ncbi:methylation-associated defense system restriction endonuclease subunit S MAD5 [Pirellulaceae bacterium SH467]